MSRNRQGRPPSSTNAEALKDGPKTYEELPTQSTGLHHLRHNICRVSLNFSVNTRHGRIETVYYKPEYNTPVEVVAKLLEANPQLRDVPAKAMTQSLRQNREELAEAYKLLRTEVLEQEGDE